MSITIKTEVDEITYQMLYQGLTEDELAGRKIECHNPCAKKMRNLFEEHIPNYSKLPRISAQKKSIKSGYISLTSSDLKNYSFVKGEDCYGRLFVALKVESKKTNHLERVVTIFQSEPDDTSLCVTSFGKGILGHNELFFESSPTWEDVKHRLKILFRGTHPEFSYHGLYEFVPPKSTATCHAPRKLKSCLLISTFTPMPSSSTPMASPVRFSTPPIPRARRFDEV